MRISDWSSDVCSSDLFIDAATLAPQRITLQDGKTIDLKLPKGVEDGTQMRLTGKGQPGPGGAGDAIITIEIKPHPFFERDGNNVRLTLPVDRKRGVWGKSVAVRVDLGGRRHVKKKNN